MKGSHARRTQVDGFLKPPRESLAIVPNPPKNVLPLLPVWVALVWVTLPPVKGGAEIEPVYQQGVEDKK